ncbi:hypothetical protein EJB05_35936, partial [Eragrostis curvula]
MPLWGLRGLSGAASGRLRRGLSTASSRPPWAMIYHAIAARSGPTLRASLKLSEPPCASHILVPDHLIDNRPRPDHPDGDVEPQISGGVSAASGDGLLLLDFMHGRAAAPVLGEHGTAQTRRLMGFDLDRDRTRFVCNPLSGQFFRLPDIDGANKTSAYQVFGILTQSRRPNAPPDRYAVACLSEDHDGEERRFAMRRFLSQTGEWVKLVGLPSPLPLARKMCIDHEAVAFAGRLWWVDVSWGAVSVDPFSDRPDLRFVELPKDSVVEPVEGLRMLGRYRRMGVSEGRLRYAEVSQEEPFVLSSFVLDDNGSCWTLGHRLPVTRLWAHGSDLREEDKPRIGVIDPLNASVMHLTLRNHAFSVNMERQKVLGCCIIDESADTSLQYSSGFLTQCVLPPWLGSSHIPETKPMSKAKPCQTYWFVQTGAGRTETKQCIVWFLKIHLSRVYVVDGPLNYWVVGYS